MTQEEMRDEFRRFRIQIAGLVVATNLISATVLLAALHLRA
ncbi:MAG: hypothetical protein OXH97_10325 [Chloroflexota bacterium]|nr:hypothetical protein [Chloroflexota bacterium]